jgi:signal peptidase
MTATRPGPLAVIRWLLDLAILGLVAVVLFAVILGRLVPLVGGQTLIIGGPSMEPALPIGSAVVIKPVATEAIAVGDIVAVQSGNEATIFTHRVVRLLALEGEPFLETKGDNNATPDGATVPATAVIGRVAGTLPLMGYVIALLSVPSGVAFVLGLGALLILGAILVDTLEGDRHRALAPPVPPRSKDPELGVEPRGSDPVPRPPRPSRQTRAAARRRSTRPTP